MFIQFSKKILLFFIFILGLLLFFIIFLIRPLVKIRIGRLEYSRIGELGPRVELYLRSLTRQPRPKNEIHIFVSKKPANRQLFKMIQRRVFVLEGKIYWKLLESINKLLKNCSLLIELPFETNEYDEFSNIEPQLSFTIEEKKYGRQLLNKIGISDNDSFVCFHSRDHLYLDRTHNHRSRQGWSYHDYRDCDINNYLTSVEYLTSKGIYALRMGAIVDKPLNINNPYIIDYATKFRYDFMDIYLSAKCKFFLGCTAGMHMIPTIFNVPVALANAIPLGDMGSSKNDIYIPKKLWLKKDKRFLRFKEIIEKGIDYWLNGRLYTQAGIEVIENTKEEILALTKEMNQRLDGTWVENDEDKELQERLHSFFHSKHRCYGFLSRMGAEFIRENKELLAS